MSAGRPKETCAHSIKVKSDSPAAAAIRNAENKNEFIVNAINDKINNSDKKTTKELLDEAKIRLLNAKIINEGKRGDLIEAETEAAVAKTVNHLVNAKVAQLHGVRIFKDDFDKCKLKKIIIEHEPLKELPE